MAVHSSNKGRGKKSGGNDEKKDAYWDRVDPSVYEAEGATGIEQSVRVFDDLDGETETLHAQFSIKGERFRKNATFKFETAEDFDTFAQFIADVREEVCG